jgi:hypothetical protein
LFERALERLFRHVIVGDDPDVAGRETGRRLVNTAQHSVSPALTGERENAFLFESGAVVIPTSEETLSPITLL